MEVISEEEEGFGEIIGSASASLASDAGEGEEVFPPGWTELDELDEIDRLLEGIATESSFLISDCDSDGRGSREEHSEKSFINACVQSLVGGSESVGGSGRSDQGDDTHSQGSQESFKMQQKHVVEVNNMNNITNNNTNSNEDFVFLMYSLLWMIAPRLIKPEVFDATTLGDFITGDFLTDLLFDHLMGV